MPHLWNDQRNLLSGCTTTKSHASARWAPGPTAAPFTAATVGLSSSHSSRMNAWTPLRSTSAVVRGSKPGLPACATVDAARSMPEQNASPVEVIRNARTFASTRPLRTASVMVSRISGVSACFASGRSSVIVRTPASESTTETVIRRTSRAVGEDVHHADAGAAATDVVLQRVPVADLDLALLGVAAQLPPALGDLRDAGGADRVALGEQPAGRVDG